MVSLKFIASIPFIGAVFFAALTHLTLRSITKTFMAFVLFWSITTLIFPIDWDGWVVGIFLHSKFDFIPIIVGPILLWVIALGLLIFIFHKKLW